MNGDRGIGTGRVCGGGGDIRGESNDVQKEMMMPTKTGYEWMVQRSKMTKQRGKDGSGGTSLNMKKQQGNREDTHTKQRKMKLA